MPSGFQIVIKDGPYSGFVYAVTDDWGTASELKREAIRRLRFRSGGKLIAPRIFIDRRSVEELNQIPDYVYFARDKKKEEAWDRKHATEAA